VFELLFRFGDCDNGGGRDKVVFNILDDDDVGCKVLVIMVFEP
jgi:hypothetical protein